VLVGRPDDSVSSITEAELQAWHDEGVVEWWGRSDHMEQVLPQAAIVALPTSYKEGLPKVLLEAAACGVPMIASDV
jgi:glycosyltransferase involved in cell wall biosynthesis